MKKLASLLLALAVLLSFAGVAFADTTNFGAKTSYSPGDVINFSVNPSVTSLPGGAMLQSIPWVTAAGNPDSYYQNPIKNSWTSLKLNVGKTGFSYTPVTNGAAKVNYTAAVIVPNGLPTGYYTVDFNGAIKYLTYSDRWHVNDATHSQSFTVYVVNNPVPTVTPRPTWRPDPTWHPVPTSHPTWKPLPTPTPYYPTYVSAPYRYLTWGCYGNDIRNLQRALERLYVFRGTTIGGNYRDLTIGSVKDYNRKYRVSYNASYLSPAAQRAILTKAGFKIR